MFELYILLLFGCLVAYFVNRKNLPASFLNLAMLLIVAIGFELIKQFQWGVNQNLHFLDHLYQPIEFTLLSSVYYHTFNNPFFKKTIIVFITVFLVFAFIASVFIEGIGQENTASFLLESFLLVVLSCLYIFELFEKPLFDNLLKIPFFWINTGILFYCAGTFFQMGLHSYFTARNPKLAEQLRLISHILNYFLYANFLTGFLCRRQKSSS
jgi:hypothetical protein